MNQTHLILDHLRSHPAGITPLDALRLFGCMRLAARISDIKAGMLRPDEDIRALPVPGQQYVRYVLVKGNGATLFYTVEDFVRYKDSEHDRHGHRPDKPVPGCEWCIRIAAGDAVFTNAPAPAIPEDDAEPLTLFDCGESAA